MCHGSTGRACAQIGLVDVWEGEGEKLLLLLELTHTANLEGRGQSLLSEAPGPSGPEAEVQERCFRLTNPLSVVEWPKYTRGGVL